jgi:hypothetical protein
VGGAGFIWGKSAFLQPPSILIPRLVIQPAVNAPRPRSSLAEELQALWRSATADNIGPALREARERVAAAPPAVQEEVAELMVSLEQLERWLRDL